MNTGEQLIYLLAFMDCWEEFSVKYIKADFHKVQAKKAFAIERLIPQIAPKWTEEQVLQLYDDIKQRNLKQEITDALKAKYDLDKMLESIKRSPWKSLV